MTQQRDEGSTVLKYEGDFVLDKLPYEWDKMTEEELMEYLRVKDGSKTNGGSLVCHGSTVEFCRSFGARAEKILASRGIEFTVREDEDAPEDGGPHWWRTITVK